MEFKTWDGTVKSMESLRIILRKESTTSDLHGIEFNIKTTVI